MALSLFPPLPSPSPSFPGQLRWRPGLRVFPPPQTFIPVPKTGLSSSHTLDLFRLPLPFLVVPWPLSRPILLALLCKMAGLA